MVLKVVRWVVRSAAWCSVLLLVVEGRPQPAPESLPYTGHDRILKNATVMDTISVFHLPLERRVGNVDEVEAGTRAIGLGDSQDVTYNVLLDLGGIKTSLVVDTGSADLWVLSKDCSRCNSHASIPLYDPVNFKKVENVTLLYGDSRTGTQASGTLGSDDVSITGVTMHDQFFASMDRTNTTVLAMGSAGIFGLGFPVSSILWNELYSLSLEQGETSSSSRERENLVRRELSGPEAKRQTISDNTDKKLGILSSFYTYGPLLTRLFLGNSSLVSSLSSPQFTVTLQRTTPSFSGDVGTLTLGGLPPGIDNSSLTWTDVRLYTPEQGGLSVPEAPGEHYPYAWEVPLDNVFFDGVQLPMSSLGDVHLPDVGTSAHIDTGNSLIRGPADIIIAILAILSNTTSSPSPFAASTDSSQYTPYSGQDYESWGSKYDPYAYAFPCGEVHKLSFEIRGKTFDVDPRDFGRPVGEPKVNWCIPNVAPTDAPELGGYLYSWSLGEPFIRGTLSSFYYGNLTHPSSDPPRIGFLSTVANDETLRLQADVRAAKSRGSYPETTIKAPTGTSVSYPITTNSNGVVQISESPLPADLARGPTSIPFGSQSNAAIRGRGMHGFKKLGSLIALFWTIAVLFLF